MEFLKRIFAGKGKQHESKNSQYKGFFHEEDKKSTGQKPRPSGLPSYWESLPSFSVVIPFSRRHLQQLKATLQEAIKFRTALLNLCRTKYFHDDIYEEIVNLKEAGEEPGDELEEYLSSAKQQHESMVEEKLGIILLYEETGRTLSPTQQKEVVQLANSYRECDVIDFSGDKLVRNPRTGVARYARGGKMYFVEPGKRYSNTEVDKILIRMLSSKQ